MPPHRPHCPRISWRACTLTPTPSYLAPGEAGITRFVSAMLASDDPMLFYKYLDVPLPPASFYAAGLAALDELSIRQKKRPYAGLSRGDMKAVAGAVLDPELEGWTGPPPFLFYLTVKNDAIDVVYGAGGLRPPEHSVHGSYPAPTTW